MNATIIPLSEAEARHGAKARALGDMLQAAFPAPDGLVLDWVDGIDVDAVADAARERAAGNGWATVAVRSSARDEDLSTGSAAGRYTTVLGVPTNLAAAADMRSAVAAVAQAMGSHRGSVIVQEMVAAEASGVAFTVDPVTGASTIVINAVPGLGDRLVSGEITPREWSVTRSNDGTNAESADSGPEDPIDQTTLAELLAMALAVEQHFGCPQDIEWAVDRSGVRVLQSRPITALEEQHPPADLDIPSGYWRLDISHGRLPRTALTSSVCDEYPVFAEISERFGVLAYPVGRRIRGWDYAMIQPVGAPAGSAPSGPRPPDWLLGTLIRLTASGRARLRAARRAVRDDEAGGALDDWNTRHAPEFRRNIARLRDMDLTGMTASQLREAVTERADLVRRGMEVHIRTGMPYILTMGRLFEVCTTRLSWSEQQTWELLAGLSDATDAPTAALRELSRYAPGTPDYEQGFARFQREQGCRALDIELAEPTLAETPQLLVATIERFADPRSGVADQVGHMRALRDERATQARTRLEGKDRQAFDAALAAAEKIYGLRDANVFLTVDAPLAMLRYAALEAGARLADNEVIDRRDDVFHLKIDELLDALDLDGPPDRAIRETARRRRAERAWAIAHPGPASYGEDPGGIPRFVGLTRAERAATEAMAFIGSSTMPVLTAAAPTQGEPLVGVPAAAGRATGRARIVHSEADFGRIEAGDILVCPSTRPSWAVIFPHLSGIVADVGGSLSHPAIIAREYGIPAVVATVHGTAVITDGEILTVDGTAGTVVRHV